MKFEKIQLKDKEFFENTLKPTDIFWEYSFACLFVWNKDKTYILKNDKYLLFYFDLEDKCLFLPPYLFDSEYLLDAVCLAQKHALDSNKKFVMRGLTESQIAKLTDFEVATKESDYDYIYSVKELIELSGKKFHSKLNFLNRFTSKYNYYFREYRANDYDIVVKLCEKWLNDKESNALWEFNAIKRALEFSDVLSLKIGLLFVGDNLVAMSISDIAKNGVAHTLFEKGDTQYEGVYQTINYLTAKHLLKDCEIVNRQEDLGIEGLKKAKLSYNPILLGKKYSISK